MQLLAERRADGHTDAEIREVITAASKHAWHLDASRAGPAGAAGSS